MRGVSRSTNDQTNDVQVFGVRARALKRLGAAGVTSLEQGPRTMLIQGVAGTGTCGLALW
jgi:hypothetical protein